MGTLGLLQQQAACLLPGMVLAPPLPGLRAGPSGSIPPPGLQGGRHQGRGQSGGELPAAVGDAGLKLTRGFQRHVTKCSAHLKCLNWFAIRLRGLRWPDESYPLPVARTRPMRRAGTGAALSSKLLLAVVGASWRAHAKTASAGYIIEYQKEMQRAWPMRHHAHQTGDPSKQPHISRGENRCSFTRMCLLPSTPGATSQTQVVHAPTDTKRCLHGIYKTCGFALSFCINICCVHLFYYLLNAKHLAERVRKSARTCSSIHERCSKHRWKTQRKH